jgi:hypothetical protein
MEFEGDAFISYAHLDNVELVEGRKGWVANLHRALEVRVGQLLGKKPQIWRDPKLSGNDSLEDTLFERLRRVAVLISVVSPRYVRSEWSLKELSEFVSAAREHGGLRIQDKARVFKVLKTPIALDKTPPELQSLLGYEFFKIDPETGRVRELDEVFGAEAQRDFWMKLDDLAHDICFLLEMLEATGEPTALPTPAAHAGHIFLAETTSDLKEPREAIKRDLQQYGYTILPDRALPMVVPDVSASIREDLARCQMSIHLIGKSYGLIPEGGTESLLEIQNELAIARGEHGAFSRLLWIPPGLQVDDERQQKVIERLRLDPRIRPGADLLETFFEDLRTVIHNSLRRDDASHQTRVEPVTARGTLTRLYCIYDRRDATSLSPWMEQLFDQEIEILQPLFEGDEAEIREYHDENLATCDGALIFYGSGNEYWLRRKLREIQKSAGYGRDKRQPAIAICLVPPKTAEKERFRTHEALVIPQWDGYAPDPLQPFLSRLKAGIV